MSIRRILRPLKPLVQPLRSRRVTLALLSVAVRWRWSSGLYCLLSGWWDREHRAVLWGKYKFLNGDDDGSGDPRRYALQRNTHRLEKGLIMRPRRDVFARDYIEETVDLLSQCMQKSGGPPHANELNSYSFDVLREYFSVTGSDPVIDRAREKFNTTVSQIELNPGNRAPHPPDPTALNITQDDLLHLARKRRSVRWYLPQPVPREIIDRAVTVASLSPSACNRQPFEFRVYDDPELVQKISSIPAGTKGFNENFPCLVVLVGKQRAFPFERDRHVIYIDSALAAMSFQFALQVEGISSCCINWPDIPQLERQMAKTLNLEPDERVTMLISLGYPDPDGLVPYSQKKSVDEIRSYNKI